MPIRKYTKTTSDDLFLDTLRDQIDPVDTLTSFDHGELDAVSIDFTDVSGNAEADIDTAMKNFGYEALGDEANILVGTHHMGKFTTATQPTGMIAREGDIGYDTDQQSGVEYNKDNWAPSSLRHIEPFSGSGKISNLFHYSEGLDNVVWTDPSGNTTITPDNADAPNGLQTADTVAWTGAGLGLRQNIPGLFGSTTYILSFWARNVSGNDTLEFSLKAGPTVTVQTDSILRRYAVQVVTSTGAGAGDFDISVSSTVGTFELWGFNIDIGSLITPYLKTKYAPVSVFVPGLVINETLLMSSGDVLVLDDSYVDIQHGTTSNDTQPIFAISNKGTNAGRSRFFATDRDPNGNITPMGSGDIAIRADGADSAIYQNTTGGVNDWERFARASEIIAVSEDTPFGGYGRLENYLRFSEDLDNEDAWADPSANSTVTPNNALAPNGELTADTVAWTSVGIGLRQFMVGTQDSTLYTLSFWGRSVSGNDTLTFDLHDGTGVPVTVSSTLSRHTIELTSGVGGDFFDVNVLGTSGTFELWGFSLALGATDVPYVKTGNYQVTDPEPGAVINNDLVVTGGIEQKTTLPPVLTGVLTDGTNLAAPMSLFISGKYAYVASFDADSLSVISIEDPANPVLVGVVSDADLDGANGVHVVGDFVYVAVFTGGRLVVVDVSDKTTPTIVGTEAVGGNPGDLYVSGRYAYMLDFGGSTVAVVDISDPTNPLEVADFGVGGDGLSEPTIAWVAGTFLYITGFDSNSLHIYNIVDAENPVFSGSLIDNTNLDGAWGLQVSGQYAYVAGQNANSLAVIDISDPTSPSLTGVVIDAVNLNAPRGLYLSGNLVYVTCKTGNSVTVVDVTDPTNPVVVNSLVDGTNLNGAIGIKNAGQFSYVVSAAANSLSVLDVHGTALTSLDVGTIESGSLKVIDDGTIGGKLDVDSGLNVGGDCNINGDVAVGRFRANSRSANTGVIQRIENTAGFYETFRTDATPEGSVTAPVGSEANDSTNGDKYVKETGAGNTGWAKLLTKRTVSIQFGATKLSKAVGTRYLWPGWADADATASDEHGLPAPFDYTIKEITVNSEVPAGNDEVVVYTVGVNKVASLASVTLTSLSTTNTAVGGVDGSQGDSVSLATGIAVDIGTDLGAVSVTVALEER